MTTPQQAAESIRHAAAGTGGSALQHALLQQAWHRQVILQGSAAAIAPRTCRFSLHLDNITRQRTAEAAQPPHHTQRGFDPERVLGGVACGQNSAETEHTRKSARTVWACAEPPARRGGAEEENKTGGARLDGLRRRTQQCTRLHAQQARRAAPSAPHRARACRGGAGVSAPVRSGPPTDPLYPLPPC